ncbi:MAG: serine/threonine protein kinase [Deltaproteobacteria bacterium]|nr:serine/threonine protein kinase [Deltaproteobacteria bacterium]MDQ3300391.1 serine/threonine protein kinase [Myxococcota bacterium]
MSEAVAEVGSTANHYQVLAHLATGGMAELFLARGMSTTGVQRYCVLKRILRHRASDVEFVRMFLDEARLAAQLQHANVAQVYDIGKLGDSYFFTMEYVHGETVRAILHHARALRRDVPIAAVLTVIAGAAAGLNHAHERIGIDGRPLDIVHRDVSPSNLMVSYEGGVKVVDFGIAKAADRAQETRSGTVKGKISYLSPEQACGLSSIDRRSDLFSLGIVMWEMLTTERLYKRAGDFESMSAIVDEPPVLPSTRRAGIPPELDAITMRLLAKEPHERFQTGSELIEALEHAAARTGEMISASTLGRFVRELFGPRPEPWLDGEALDTSEGVTVASEPIPRELAIPVEADMDLQLANVPRLTLERAVVELDEQITPLPTTRMPVVDPLLVARDGDFPTRPQHKAIATSQLASAVHIVLPPAAALAPDVGLHRTLPGIGSGPRDAVLGSGPREALLGSGPRATVLGSGPRAMIASSGPRVFPAAAVSAPHAKPGDQAPGSRLGWQLVLVMAIAAVVGSLTMWLVMRGGGDPPSVAAAGDAALATPVATDAGVEVAVVSVPVGMPGGMPGGMTDAAVGPGAVADAAAAPSPADAAPPVDARAVVVDAAEVPKPRPTKPDLEAAMAEHRYWDVVTRCSKTLSNPPICVLAACHVEQTTKARTWFARVAKARRRQLIAACKQQNVELVVTKPAIDPCVADPMACQH